MRNLAESVGATWLRRTDLDVFCISPDSSVRTAIQSIQDGLVQICLVVDGERRLIGTVTDGDIRRGILLGVPLDGPVVKVMNVAFQSARASSSAREVIQTMRRRVVHQLPILDDLGRLIELAVLEDLLRFSNLRSPALIMAGGEGRRLRPLTADVPKPLLEIGDKAILEIVIDLCASAGVDNFYISVNYLAEQIKSRIGDGSRWGVSIEYLEEEESLGTGGALGLIDHELQQPLLVINGDVLTRVDFRQLLGFHAAHESVATVCTRVHEIEIPFGVVESNGSEFLGIAEKPTLRHMVSAGIYVLSPEVVQLVARDVCIDMPDVIRMASENGPVSVFPIHEYWADLGTHDALRQAGVDWS